jgi:GNAT superfamily N-acetyltransferase
MNMKYEVVKYNPELKSQIVELQKHLWSPDVTLNIAYLEWKYDHNPYVDNTLIYMVLYQGQVVGMRGMYGAKWQIGQPSQILPALCAGDLVIAPEHRNRGLFTKIMKVALNDLGEMGYTYIFNLSAGRITLLGSLAMGWRSVGSLQTMYWGPNSHHEPRYVGKRLFLSSVEKEHPFYFLDREGVQRKAKVNLHVSTEQSPRPKEMAELIKRIGSDGRIRHVRDEKYFAWRFQNPLSLYRFLFWEDARLEGYLVLQTLVYTDGVRASIADWEASNMQVRTDLLHAAIHLGNFAYLTIWSATLQEDVKTLLQNKGFKYFQEPRNIKGSGNTVLLKPIRHETLKADWALANRRFLNLSDWDLRMIYSDGY